MTNSVNLSCRYINALQQLPQFHYSLDINGMLTHMYTGVRVFPTGKLEDPDDDSGFLQLVFPGGHSIEVHGFAYLDGMAKEAAEIEVATMPDDLGIPARKLSQVQLRTADLVRHLRGKHWLESESTSTS